VAKPGGTISLSIDEIKDALISKVRVASRARLKPARSQQTAKAASAAPSARAAKAAASPRTMYGAPVERPAAYHRSVVGAGVVLIGVSTGGPRTLESILPFLPANCPWPVLVAQHMPASFTLPFAERMNALCPLHVVEASRPMPLAAGTIYIGKGSADMQVVERAGKMTVIAKPESKEFLWHPSVELLGRSVLEHYAPENVLAVMLTGMGYDGADAFAEIKRKGGRTIAESEESCVVFGMPAELINRGGATVTLPAEKIALQINAWLGC
jgi:two-component system chemotaxis response regulator CheB